MSQSQTKLPSNLAEVAACEMDEETFTEFEHFDFESNLNFQNGWSSISNIVEFNRIGVEYLKAKIFFFSKYYKPIQLEKYLLWKKKQSATVDHERPTDEKPEKLHSHCAEAENVFDDVILATAPKDQAVVLRNEDTLLETNLFDNISAELNNDTCDKITSKLNSISLSQGEIVTSELDCGISSDKTIDVNQSEQPHNSQDDKTDCSLCPDGIENVEAAPLSLLEIATYIQNGIPIPGLVPIQVQPTNQEPTPSTCARKPKPWETCVTESVGS